MSGQKQLKTILMDKKLRETTNLCALLPSDVTDFAVLPAQRLLAGNNFLSYVMWSRSDQWERALL